VPEQTRDRSLTKDRSADEGESADHGTQQDASARAAVGHDVDRGNGATRAERWEDATNNDAKALAERWPELTEEAEKILKDAYRDINAEAERLRHGLDTTESHNERGGLVNAVESLRTELEATTDRARAEVVEARRTAAEGDGTLTVDAQRALEESLASVRELAARAAVLANDATKEQATPQTARTDQRESRDFDARWNEARQADEDALATRWAESTKESEGALKDAYREVAAQADLTKGEIEAAEIDVALGYEKAASAMESRHTKEASANEVGKAKDEQVSSTRELEARQDGERRGLEKQRALAEANLSAARETLESELAAARRDVATERESPDQSVNAKAGVQALEARKALLERVQEDARRERETTAWTSRAEATAANSRAADNPRDRAASVAFARDAERTIAKEATKTEKHPLDFLLDPATKEFRSRQRANDAAPAVEVGHEVSHSARTDERFMLEDADFNDWSNRYAESKGNAIVKEPVDIGGVLVERRSARMWERLGLLKLPNNQRVRDLPAHPGSRGNRR
jgi:hypothetical protein